jgi:transcriptional regulator with XRE-family HTH domain
MPCYSGKHGLPVAEFCVAVSYLSRDDKFTNNWSLKACGGCKEAADAGYTERAKIVVEPTEEDWSPDPILVDLESVREEIVSLNPDWNEERLKKTLPTWFNAGVLKAICKEISTLLSAAGVKHKEIAERLGVSRPAVSLWFADGSISASHLAALQHRYRRELRFLYHGDVRRFKERTVSGYIEAMFSLRRLVMGDQKCDKPLTRQEFAILDQSLQNEEWNYGDKEIGMDQILLAAQKELEGVHLRIQSPRPVMQTIETIRKVWTAPYLYSIVLLDEALQ